MEFLYQDRDLIVCVKQPGMLSTDEPGGVPEAARMQLEDMGACVRPVHRLDRVVGGLMLLARSTEMASKMGKQLQAGGMKKRYLAVVHGALPEQEALLEDLLRRDARERKTYVTDKPGKDVRLAQLYYRRLAQNALLSLAEIQLITGRTHQIRAQFSSRGFPLWGDRKYSLLEDAGDIALWSYRLDFCHPRTGEALRFSLLPPRQAPWEQFAAALWQIHSGKEEK